MVVEDEGKVRAQKERWERFRGECVLNLAIEMLLYLDSVILLFRNHISTHINEQSVGRHRQTQAFIAPSFIPSLPFHHSHYLSL